MFMVRSRSSFVCQNCGAVSNRWQGKCESCEEWNTIVEEQAASGIGAGTPASRGGTKGRPFKLEGLDGQTQEAPRIVSTLNLVAAGLGITIVPASLSRLPLEGVTYRPLTGRPAIKVPLNLACRRDDPSAATQAFIDQVRRLA